MAGLWAAGGVWYKVYFAGGDGASLLERLQCSSEVELTPLSPPSPRSRAVLAGVSSTSAPGTAAVSCRSEGCRLN